jgi:dolichol-phosphate mannosyltransferase
MTIFLVAQKDGPQQPVLQCPDLTIVLPTLNEGNSLSRMLEFLTGHYPGVRIIVADDGSTDRTKEIALNFSDHNVMFLDRSGEAIHGLTASVLDAVALAETPYVVVLDADGQHPPQKVMEVLNLLRLGHNLVVGSRVQVEGHWPLDRKLLSYTGTGLGKLSLIARGKSFLSYDILSGFFGIRRPYFQKVVRNRTTRFRLRGYKVLFDLLKLLPKTEELEEVYHRFETRQGGQSKQNLRVYREYLKSIFT